MTIELVKRNPDKGYFGRQLWIPKKHVNVISIKAGLEFPVANDEGIEFLQLWEENDTHLIVPREYIPREHYPRVSFPIVSTQPKKYPHIRFNSKVVLDFKKPDKDEQRKAFADMMAGRCGILNLACGKGKTIIALHHIAQHKVPALVIVNNTTLINQWHDRIREFLEIEGGVGIVQGPPARWDWEGRGIVLAMIHTLSLRYEEMPTGFDRYFGNIYYDECFPAGTLIDGVPIERRQVGNLIRSYDDRTNEVTHKKITKLFTRTTTTNEIGHLCITGRNISCTSNHPFLTPFGWIAARDLLVGDYVKGILREDTCNTCQESARHEERDILGWLRVESSTFLESGSPTPSENVRGESLVYNLEVEDTHTYLAEGIVVHNCHHLSAPLFAHTAPLFYGNRFGLTATVAREDGLEPIYQYHIGPVFHRNLTQELKPRIYFQEVPVHVNIYDPAVKEHIFDARGMLNIPKLRTYLGGMEENNRFIAAKIREPLKHNRKILVLSHSVNQLRILNEMFPDSGLCTGFESPESRIKTLKSKRVTFGTHQLVREALDEQTLDTMFFLTPFGSSAIDIGGKNTLQQGMGRILRYREGKKTPVVVIMDHVYIPKFHKMCRKLKQVLHNWPRDEGGPFEYELLKPVASSIKEPI